MIKVGTCGFSRSRRQIFRNLDIVEVQQTFYDPRNIHSLEKLSSEAPKDFEFTIKAWMLVTHPYNPKLWRRLKEEVPYPKDLFGNFKLNEAVCWAWERTLEAAKILKSKIILLQSPASFKPTEENLKIIFNFLSECWPDKYQLVWEPRGEWWKSSNVLEKLYNNFNLFIAGDVLRGRFPPSQQPILYTRLHGLGGGEVNYKYKYSNEDLEKLYAVIVKLNKNINYILFNNIYSYDDAVRFKKLVMDRLNTR